MPENKQLEKMMGAINPHHPVLLAAILLAFAVYPAHAVADETQDAVGSTAQTPSNEGKNAKKLALIRLLARAGKNEEAAAGLRSLYPDGPPSGDFALEYYRIIGNTTNGWGEAKTGLEKLVNEKPDDTRYRLALAQHLTVRPATRLAGIKALAKLAKTKLPDADKQPGVSKQQVLDAWRHALDDLDNNAVSIPLYQQYLTVDPGNVSARDSLAAAQRSEAKRLPWLMRDKADAQLAAGHPEEAITTLKNALQLDPTNPWVRFDLSRLYHKQGDKQQGRALMDEGLSIAPGDADMLYADAMYISLLDEAGNALRLLEKIPASQRSPAMQRLKQKMAIQAKTQQAQALARDGNRADMQATMERAEAEAGSDAELLNIVANAWLDLGDPKRGVGLMQRLAEQPSAPLATRLYYAGLLNRAEHDEELAAALDKLSTAKKLSGTDKEDLRYLKASLAARRADNFRHAGNIDAAKSVLAAALEHDPENTDMLKAMARVHVAAHDPQQARNIYQQILLRTPNDVGAKLALTKIADDENDAKQTLTADNDERAIKEPRRAASYVVTGADYLNKPGGTPGISNLKTLEIPVEIRIPVGYDAGQAFIKMDRVSTDAGTLSTSDSPEYGKVRALVPTGITGAPTQSAHGTALAAGFEKDGWRADLGTTPLGFPVSSVVGGVKWSHYTEISGFSFDVSRRPITSSLLSYSGAHDPVTDEVWGGVRSIGMSLHASRDKGRLNGFIDLGYYSLTGKNVLDNTEAALRTGFDWSFINKDDMRLTAGLAFTNWRYRENLRFYTFGHGGYYSPQKYYSLALPFRWTGRKANWSYLLQGAVSASESYEKDMPYYPTSVALETLAGNPVYTGGNGHGTGYSLGGTLEYRFTDKLFGGGRVSIDRSDYYTPNFATIYLRYLFDAHTEPVSYPPDPVKPYSRF